MTNVIKSSMDMGMQKAENLEEKPKYMIFSVLTILVYEYAYGWIGVVTWFFLNVVVDYVLMKRAGEI